MDMSVRIRLRQILVVAFYEDYGVFLLPTLLLLFRVLRKFRVRVGNSQLSSLARENLSQAYNSERFCGSLSL